MLTVLNCVESLGRSYVQFGVDLACPTDLNTSFGEGQIKFFLLRLKFFNHLNGRLDPSVITKKDLRIIRRRG